jgi:four helix bundle protein
MGEKRTVRSYKDLQVWRAAMALAKQVYFLTAHWPKGELYGLTSQVRRASVSIPSNIAEGYGRQSRVSYSAFLKIARGSLNEVETQLLLAEQVGLASSGEIASSLAAIDELNRMLNSLIRRLAND